jgi:heme/copper-type cytochrome/quinol oxidase subunit 2
MRSKNRIAISVGIITPGLVASANVASQIQPEQLPAHDNDVQDNSMMGFFAVGLVINIALVAAYFIWAYKQWKRKRDN